jgi:hypothetical protein
MLLRTVSQHSENENLVLGNLTFAMLQDHVLLRHLIMTSGTKHVVKCGVEPTQGEGWSRFWSKRKGQLVLEAALSLYLHKAKRRPGGHFIQN